MQIFYLLLGAVTLFDYFRWRDRPRLVMALTFASFGGFILTQDLLALNWSLPGLYALNHFLLPLHACLLLVLVDYFQAVPRWVRWTALGGLVAVTLLDWIFGGLTGAGAGLLIIIIYFGLFESYAAALIVRGARRTQGLTRRRLALAAAGSGALALVAILLLASAFVRPLQAQLTWIVPLGTGLAAVCQYLGFATPAWLRQPWQLAELYRFLRQIQAGQSLTVARAGTAAGAAELDERTELVLNELCLAGMRAGGGLAAAVALAPPGAGALSLPAPAAAPPGAGDLTLHAPTQPRLHGAQPGPRGAIARAWSSRQAQVATAPADFGLPASALAGLTEADTLLVVPILVGRQAWGLLLVLRRSLSPFVAADLRLLGLLAEQVAQSLEYSALINQLRQRTLQLETANKELESFSYSVSHDLRTPLRALDGLSLALLEDYGRLLPPEAANYLDRIRAAAQRMGELVDDLLNLAQVSRSEMRSAPVDLSALAQSVWDELRLAEPNRVVAFTVQPALQADGDARLLRQALTNLLGNAWKFSGKRPSASVEFGASGSDDARVYFVRDDGAGFDMTYADRLFGPFQRLHQTSDFPGTGVGLAIVERIVRRHGGRIWAEAAPEQGATFYFTLGAPPGANPLEVTN